MALICELKVVPSAGKNGWIYKDNQLKCFLKNPPEKGKANKELIKLLAKALGITQNQVTIVSGLTQRIKKVKVETDISFEQLLAHLGIERQMGLF